MKITLSSLLIFLAINCLSQEADTIFFDNEWNLTGEKGYKYKRIAKKTDTLLQITDYYNNGRIYSSGFCNQNSDITYENILGMTGPCYWYDKKGRMTKMALYKPFSYPKILDKIVSDSSKQNFDIKSELTLWIYYHKNGNKQSYGFRFGDCKAHGEWTIFTKKGLINSKYIYEYSFLVQATLYYKGYKTHIFNLKDQKKEGEFKNFHLYGGSIRIHGHYKNNRKDGEFIYYLENGDIEKIVTYKSGKKIKTQIL